MQSEIKLKAFTLGEDYPEICEWWRAHGWKYIPVDSLPASGIVAFDENHKYAAVFFYFIESRWGWIDYLVSNPAAPLRGRTQSLELVVSEAKKVMQLAGTRRIITILKNENLISLFKGLNFIEGDREMTTMVCDLEGETA